MTIQKKSRKKAAKKKTPPSQRRGRGNSKLNDVLAEKIVNAIEGVGAYMETAASYAGVDRKTFLDWLKKGRRDLIDGKDNAHSRFVARLDVAIAQAEVSDLATISHHANGYTAEETKVVTHPDGTVETTITKKFRRDWQAAAWRLERKHPQRWGKRMELTGKDGGPLVDFKSLVIETYDDGRRPARMSGNGKRVPDSDREGTGIPLPPPYRRSAS